MKEYIIYYRIHGIGLGYSKIVSANDIIHAISRLENEVDGAIVHEAIEYKEPATGDWTPD